MTSYVTIPNTDIDAESPIDVDLMTAMRDNPTAIAEGTAGAPRVVGANLVEISTQTWSTGVASVDFTTGLTSDYEQYVFMLEDVLVATDNVNLIIRISEAASFKTTSYHTSYYHATAAATALTVGGSLNDGGILISQAQGSAATEGASGTAWMFNPAGTAKPTSFHANNIFEANDGSMRFAESRGQYQNTAAVDGVRFLASSGNLTSGTISLYGVKPV